MRTKLTPLAIALTSIPFAFYKMGGPYKNKDKFALITKNYAKERLFYDHHTNYVLITPNKPKDQNFSENSTPYDFLLGPFLIKKTLRVVEKGIPVKFDILDTFSNIETINFRYLQSNQNHWVQNRIPLSQKKIFLAPLEVIVNNEINDEKVMLTKEKKSINLQESLMNYYKDKTDTIHQNMIQLITDFKFDDSKDKAIYDIGQAGFDVHKNKKILDRLREYNINGLFAVIKDGSDTVLFGTAKNSKENIFWITKIKGDLSTLFSINSN